MNRKNGFSEFMSILKIIIGALAASFSVACILLPNDAIDYGTAGIAIIINKLTDFNLSLCIFFVFLPFLIAGAVLLGRKFTIKALIGTLAYTVGMEIFQKIPFELNTEHFLAVAFGGAILGAGLSLILRNGGCIDGSEILANIIVKKRAERTGRSFSMSSVLLAFNAVVYILVFALIDRNSALLSLLVYVVATAVIDHFTDRFEAIKQVTIITKSPEQIINSIREGMKKTCTIMDSRGAIAGENTTLICYVNYFELTRVKDILRTNPGSFCTISTIDEVLR